MEFYNKRKTERDIVKDHINEIKAEIEIALDKDRLWWYNESVNSIIWRIEKKIIKSKDDDEKDNLMLFVLWIKAFINSLKNLLFITDNNEQFTEFDDFYLDLYILALLESLDHDNISQIDINTAIKEINGIIFIVSTHPELIGKFSWIDEIKFDCSKGFLDNLLLWCINYSWIIIGKRTLIDNKNVLLVDFTPTDKWNFITMDVKYKWTCPDWIWFWYADVESDNIPMPTIKSLSQWGNYDFDRLPNIIITSEWIRMFVNWFLAILSNRSKLFRKTFWIDEMLIEIKRWNQHNKEDIEMIKDMLNKRYYYIDIPYTFG